jgi:hypothetical protein
MKAGKMTSADAPEPNPLWQLRGIAKNIFKKTGEWEDIVKREREQFSDLHDKSAR